MNPCLAACAPSANPLLFEARVTRKKEVLLCEDTEGSGVSVEGVVSSQDGH